LPAYTDYLKVFPGRGFTMAGEQIRSIEQIDAALAGGGVVIISNPHNPTGAHLDPNDLVAIATPRPDSILVVDESYVGFTPNPVARWVIGGDAANIVVLQSTTKFYGIAATRSRGFCGDCSVGRRTGDCPVSTYGWHARRCGTWTGPTTPAGCSTTAPGSQNS
jgi:histidinol-phosphate/aromatic aminotransferase/cobyric acid decarboxylase-like protein